MKTDTDSEKNQRVVALLNRQEIDFLDQVGKDALFSTGLKVSRSKLISWLIDFAQKLNLSGQSIKTAGDFESKFQELLSRNLNNPLPTPEIQATHGNFKNETPSPAKATEGK